MVGLLNDAWVETLAVLIHARWQLLRGLVSLLVALLALRHRLLTLKTLGWLPCEGLGCVWPDLAWVHHLRGESLGWLLLMEEHYVRCEFLAKHPFLVSVLELVADVERVDGEEVWEFKFDLHLQLSFRLEFGPDHVDAGRHEALVDMLEHYFSVPFDVRLVLNEPSEDHIFLARELLNHLQWFAVDHYSHFFPLFL